MIRVVVPAAALALGLLPLPAHAAAPQPFKVVKTTKLRGSDSLDHVIAPSRKAAFAFGGRGVQQATPIAYRYNGKAWAQVALPKAAKGFISDVDYSSASNVWAAVPGNYSLLETPEEPGEECPAPVVEPERRIPSTLQRIKALRGDARVAEQPSRLLRWNGKKWTVGATFKTAVVLEVVTFGPKDVRAYGMDKKGSAVWRFNGKSWKRSAVPDMFSSVTKVKGSVWGVTASEEKGYRLVQQTATGWRDRTPKALPAFVQPTKDKAGTVAILTSVTVSGNRLYLGTVTLTGTLCAEDAKFDPALYVGQGGVWRKDKLPKSVPPFAFLLSNGLVADRKGGAYLYSMENTTLFHRSAKGVWSGQKLSAKSRDFRDFAVVPGTASSLWGVGLIQGKWDSDGMIARRGPA